MAATAIAPHKKEKWDSSQVCKWLKSIGLNEHVKMFQDQGIIGRHLEMLEDGDLKELGMSKMADRLTFKTELNRSSSLGLAKLPQNLCKLLMMEAIEESMKLVPEIPDDFRLDDHTVYKDVYNREIIVPCYLTIGVQALRGMDTNNCCFGCDFGFQLRLKTDGLPRIASEFITENIKFSVNQQVHDRTSRSLSMEVENSTNQVSIAGNFNTTGDDALMMFAGESEMSFEMWRAFPFDRPTVILRFEILPIHLPHPVRDRPWVVYFQMHEAEHPATMVSFSYGSDQMPSFNVAQSKTEVHLLPSAPVEVQPVNDIEIKQGFSSSASSSFMSSHHSNNDPLKTNNINIDARGGVGGGGQRFNHTDDVEASASSSQASPFQRPFSVDGRSGPFPFLEEEAKNISLGQSSLQSESSDKQSSNSTPLPSYSNNGDAEDGSSTSVAMSSRLHTRNVELTKQQTNHRTNQSLKMRRASEQVTSSSSSVSWNQSNPMVGGVGLGVHKRKTRRASWISGAQSSSLSSSSSGSVTNSVSGGGGMSSSPSAVGVFDPFVTGRAHVNHSQKNFILTSFNEDETSHLPAFDEDEMDRISELRRSKAAHGDSITSPSSSLLSSQSKQEVDKTIDISEGNNCETNKKEDGKFDDVSENNSGTPETKDAANSETHDDGIKHHKSIETDMDEFEDVLSPIRTYSNATSSNSSITSSSSSISANPNSRNGGGVGGGGGMMHKKSSFFGSFSGGRGGNIRDTVGEVDDALDPLEYNEPAFKRAHAKTLLPSEGGVLLYNPAENANTNYNIDSGNDQGHVHTPVLRIKIHLYREPNAMIFNGFFPMIIVNCGTILVAIPQELDAGNFTQTLENSLTVMLALFAFLIFLRERLPPIPEATWVDNTVCTSVVMILLAMIGATSSWCLGSNGPSRISGVDDEEEEDMVNLVRKILTNGCFYCIIMLQIMLLASVSVQWVLYRQRVDQDYEMSCKIRALVERKFKANKWQQRKRLPPPETTFNHIPSHHKKSLFAKLHHQFDSHGKKLTAFNTFLSKYDWLYLGDMQKINYGSYVANLFGCKTYSSSSFNQKSNKNYQHFDLPLDQRQL